MSERAQEWLTKRLAPLEPSDFEDGIQIVCTCNLEPPPPFREVWTVYSDAQDVGQQRLSEVLAELQGQLEELRTILVFSHPADGAQVSAFCRLVQGIDGLGPEAPPIIWVPHTAAPDAGIETPEVDTADPEMGSMVSHLLELGLDSMVAGEPEGFRLALAVKTKLHKLAVLSRTLNDVVNERRSRQQYADYLQDCTDCMIWDYLRTRLAPGIPPVDYELASGELTHIDGYATTELLGRGTFGSVFRLAPQEGAANQTLQVVKILNKDSIRDVSSLKCLRRQLEVMRLVSSEQWAHPNVTKVYHVYHSVSHLFLRMEFGGSQNLCQRLNDRREGDAERPLPLRRALALLQQAVSALTHLHLRPHVCHRDVKPENFTVQDQAGSPLKLKLIDFTLAFIQREGSMCRTPCGTVPFAAPEVFSEPQYSGMAADIWSLGVTMLEVLCGPRVVEKVANLGPPANAGTAAPGSHPDDGTVHKLRSTFQKHGVVRNLLQARCRPELRPLLQAARPLLEGVLIVDVARRWTTEQVASALQLLMTAVPDR